MIDVTILGRLPSHVDRERILSTLRKILRLVGKRETGMIAVHFISEADMKRMNSLYRKKRRATDVLSFAPLAQTEGLVEWGDLCICPSVARREARRRGIDLQEEIIRLVAHGFLHLLGYDHATEAEELRMFRLQERVVEQMCV